MWRKTRSYNRGSGCRGTDPNRNWGYKWGLKGASTNPCDGNESFFRNFGLTKNFSETYRGPQAFSEPETRAVRDFILSRKYELQMYLTLHSYGQMFLYPWGYDRLGSFYWPSRIYVFISGLITPRSMRWTGWGGWVLELWGGGTPWAALPRWTTIRKYIFLD